MKKDASHIRQIKVVSNTHWDREFRRSFEKTRRNLLRMLDAAIDILEKDPGYHSYTLDGHTIPLDDYLKMRPEHRQRVEELVKKGRLIIGPWYTLVEQFSVSQEALVRNLLWGKRMMQEFKAPPGTVAYTPASWGQTGQLPQILRDFGLDKIMFYRGISHHEADAEYVWQAPDGAELLASRFAVYARYNWYYQVHRPVTRGRVFEKDYHWAEFDESLFMCVDGPAAHDRAFDVKHPAGHYDKSVLKKAIMDMIEREGAHFTTPVFLAMHGHDISHPMPFETRMVRDAQQVVGEKYDVEHTSLELFWRDCEAALDRDALPVLTGERRSYLKKGMWTFLFPSTISARTGLKQQDFQASTRLVYLAEPFDALAAGLGAQPSENYLNRAWSYLLANHTHDANGGCAPDAVCLDMAYRYRKVTDICDILTADAMSHISVNLSPKDTSPGDVFLVVYNSLPYPRDAVLDLKLHLPRHLGSDVALVFDAGKSPVHVQNTRASSVFVDSPWDVPAILDSNEISATALVKNLPACGYRVYKIQPDDAVSNPSLLTDRYVMENPFLRVAVNSNGTVDVTDKKSGRIFEQLNHLSDEGEAGNAWRHVSPEHDNKVTSLDVTADRKVMADGPFCCAISATFEFSVPVDYGDGTGRNPKTVSLPVQMTYKLSQTGRRLEIEASIDNRAKDHWLRANFRVRLKSSHTWADSHFDVVSREIALPVATGWAEQPQGTHPLRTFVDVTDGKTGLAIFSRGLFEYEAMQDKDNTLALTLLRACRIKLAVSEEKQTELPDSGIQCPGVQNFHYAVMPHQGDWQAAQLLNQALDYCVPVRAAVTSRGHGRLPRHFSLVHLDNPAVQLSCLKPEKNNGVVLRLYNPSLKDQAFTLRFGPNVISAEWCRMDETRIEQAFYSENEIRESIGGKKIKTLRVFLEKPYVG